MRGAMIILLLSGLCNMLPSIGRAVSPKNHQTADGIYSLRFKFRLSAHVTPPFTRDERMVVELLGEGAIKLPDKLYVRIIDVKRERNRAPYIHAMGIWDGFAIAKCGNKYYAQKVRKRGQPRTMTITTPLATHFRKFFGHPYESLVFLMHQMERLCDIMRNTVSTTTSDANGSETEWRLATSLESISGSSAHRFVTKFDPESDVLTVSIYSESGELIGAMRASNFKRLPNKRRIPLEMKLTIQPRIVKVLLPFAEKGELEFKDVRRDKGLRDTSGRPIHVTPRWSSMWFDGRRVSIYLALLKGSIPVLKSIIVKRFNGEPYVKMEFFDYAINPELPEHLFKLLPPP